MGVKMTKINVSNVEYFLLVVYAITTRPVYVESTDEPLQSQTQET